MAKQAALICGNDEYLVTSHAREWVDAVCPTDEQALGLELVEGKASTIDEAVYALDGVLAALRTVGLFGGKKESGVVARCYLFKACGYHEKC